MTRCSLAKFLGAFFSVPTLPAAPPPPPVFSQPEGPLPPGDTRDPVALAFLSALERGGQVTVYYHGGATPGAMRRFSPQAVYRLVPGGRLYATGTCHLRKETRTFRLDRARLG